MTNEYEIMGPFTEPFLKPLDRLARRVANDVIEGRYSSAREAAVANLTEYADETTDEKRIQYQQSNFARKIVKTLAEMGFDKHGKPS